MNRIKKISFHAISRPLRTLFSTSLGTKTVMRSVLVKVILDNGEFGLGEVPTSFVLKHETIDAIQERLKKISPALVGLPIEDYEDQIPGLRAKYPDTPMTLSGLEVALFRAWLKAQKMSEHGYWGAKRNRLETDITIPFLSKADELDRWMRYILKKGFYTYKLKVSGNVAADRQILTSVYRQLENHQESFALRIDGNQGYNRTSYLQLIEVIEKERFKIQLIEQPLPENDYAGLKFIEKHSPVPIILDETVFDSRDLARVIDQELADGINIKFAKSGISESRKMMRTARRNGLKLMIGCMTETMIGLSAGIYCTAGSGQFNYVDLDGVYFLHHRNTFGQPRIEPPEFYITD